MILKMPTYSRKGAYYRASTVLFLQSYRNHEQVTFHTKLEIKPIKSDENPCEIELIEPNFVKQIVVLTLSCKVFFEIPFHNS